jgi:cell division protein ZapA (FtsZ GTPase activity inhibitor)
MSSERKLYRVDIDGELYSLVSDEGPEHIMQAAYQVDQLIREIAAKSSNSTIDGKKIAVLVALQMANELIKLQKEGKANHDKGLLLVDNIDRLIGLFI